MKTQAVFLKNGDLAVTTLFVKWRVWEVLCTIRHCCEGFMYNIELVLGSSDKGLGMH